MKTWRILMYVAGIVALVSLIIGIISRLALTPIAGITASAFLRFTDTCLLFAVNFGLLQLLQAKRE
ncbi:MAG: hypothetical protein DRP95_06865 [Candidatus Latescibacterota bacterium]|nr:MAG: hypothetical protein DRP95_06865 [Candidatus Latescibacterota bacterium]